jgi:hypothetical protein
MGSSSETGEFQFNWTPIGTPVPCNGIDRLLLPDELLAITKTPFAVPSDAGSNITFRVAEPPGANVAGRVSPAVENPAPDVAAELIVTDSVPAEVSVRVCVALEFSAEDPKETELELTVSSEATGLEGVPICRLNVAEDPSPVAVKVAR